MNPLRVLSSILVFAVLPLSLVPITILFNSFMLSNSCIILPCCFYKLLYMQITLAFPDSFETLQLHFDVHGTLFIRGDVDITLKNKSCWAESSGTESKLFAFCVFF